VRLKNKLKKNKKKFFNSESNSIFDLSITQKQNKMQVVVNNTKTKSTKEMMNLLMDCIKDSNVSKQDKNFYYSEYLKLAKIYLQESK
jgi:hypothetical protein